MKACAEHGRDGMDHVCKEVEGKTPEEVGATAVLCLCSSRALVGPRICKGVLGAKGRANRH